MNMSVLSQNISPETETQKPIRRKLDSLNDQQSGVQDAESAQEVSFSSNKSRRPSHIVSHCETYYVVQLAN